MAGSNCEHINGMNISSHPTLFASPARPCRHVCSLKNSNEFVSEGEPIMADIKLTLSQNRDSVSEYQGRSAVDGGGGAYLLQPRTEQTSACRRRCGLSSGQAGLPDAPSGSNGKLRDLHPNLELVSYTGEEQPVGPESWQVACRKMEIASHPSLTSFHSYVRARKRLIVTLSCSV